MIIIDAFKNTRFATEHEEAIGQIMLKHINRERPLPSDEPKDERRERKDAQSIWRDRRRAQVIDFVKQHPRRRIEIQEALAMAERSVQQILANLVRDNILEKRVEGKHIIYSVRGATRSK